MSHPTATSLTARQERHRSVEAQLAPLSDGQLAELLTTASILGAGIGGTTGLLQVAGTAVFVKRVPLTDLERRPDNLRSTANLFDLPVSCQYGVGGPPPGAWRELAANQLATSWLLAGRTECFPLLHHWRVLEGPIAPLHEELADVERAVASWHGSAAVRQRIEAIGRASATVTMFLEYLPHTLPAWLSRQLAGDGAEAAIAMVERSLLRDVAFMNTAGLFHFDGHFGNLLTDGERLFFCDLGLATSPRFQLSRAESDFLAAHLSHDLCYSLTRLVDWLVTELTGAPDWSARNQTIARVAAGEPLVGVMPAAASVIERYAPIAVVINDFYRQLHLVERDTRYPLADVLEACQRCGLELPAAS